MATISSAFVCLMLFYYFMFYSMLFYAKHVVCLAWLWVWIKHIATTVETLLFVIFNVNFLNKAKFTLTLIVVKEHLANLVYRATRAFTSN